MSLVRRVLQMYIKNMQQTLPYSLNQPLPVFSSVETPKHGKWRVHLTYY